MASHIKGQSCHKRGCGKPADFALHTDGQPDVFKPHEDADGRPLLGSQSEERITENRDFYCAEHAQEAVEAFGDDAGRIIISGV